MPHNKVPPHKGADGFEDPPKGASCTAWGYPGHQSAKYSSSLTNVRVRVDGGGGGGLEARGKGTVGDRGGKPNVTAIIQAAVVVLVTAAMEGV